MMTDRKNPMLLNKPEELTQFVLNEMAKTPDPRTREVMVGLVKHLHAFVREVKLTEAEFHQACGLIAKLGQQSSASHNEVTLMAGSLGVSALVCLSNNGQGGTRATTANLMGPFWREGSPLTAKGDSIVRSPTPGEPLFVNAWVKDLHGQAVSHARVDVWHSSSEGFYENQDASQAEMNLRGCFETDEEGHFAFQSIKPAGYPIPINGLVGEMLNLLGRHNMRPAHLHFLIYKEGYKTQFSQVYSSDDPYLETDVQFGVTQALIGHYVRHENEPDPSGVQGRVWWSLDFEFEIEAGTAYLPKPPISAKVLA
jgi:hydroxyquinol 1,2-dioxygenase